MPQMVERKLSTREQNEFSYCTEVGLNLLKLPKGENDPAKIVLAVDRYVDKWQNQQRSMFNFSKKPDVIDTALGLGIVWGNQMVRHFHWQWTCIVETGKTDIYGVVSPDRSMILYPTYYIRECLENSHMDCVAMLSFNMLNEGKIPKFKENDYVNVLEGIHRIVPKG